MLGVDAPEEFGGVGLDKAAALVVSSHTAGSASFSAAFGATGNLAISPILYFGTADQKARYLPKLISGEMVGAYALSESGSGSDALGASARATRLPDGGFALTGEKMWITNGGFADVFIVFAKVDGEQFTAFIVERGFKGVSTGHEEHKMGLHGSSTTPLILQDAQVPAGNLLGEIGKGHKVAFNVLNFGRFKLGAMCVGGCYGAIGESARYAATRRQFGKPIAEFGAIKHKLAEMTVQTYAIESLLYRTAGLIDASIAQNGGPGAVLAAMEEFAIEASIAKVAGSETLQFRARRERADPRRQRVREGLPRRAALPRRAGESHFRRHERDQPAADSRHADPTRGERRPAADSRSAQAAGRDSRRPGSLESRGDGPLDEQRAAVQAFKKIALMSLGLAMQRYGEELTDQQEVLMAIADIVIAVACAESALLRASSAAGPMAPFHADAAAIFINDAAVARRRVARSTCSRRWPKAIHFVRISPPSGGCSRSRRLIP